MTDAQVDKLMAKARELKLKADKELAEADKKKK
jgi:hypothetical protein